MQRSRTATWPRTLRHCLLSSAYARSCNSLPNSAPVQRLMSPGRVQPTPLGMLTLGVPAQLPPAWGGIPMVAPLTPSDCCVSPAQVWPALPTECKTRLVWLWAQLAVTRVIAHAEGRGQEVS